MAMKTKSEQGLAKRRDEGAPERSQHKHAAISARGLRMRYGAREVVRGIDLEVHAGEVFAFLGPNGAGKTTTVEILEGYRKRTGGEVSVLGSDPAQADASWRARIGVVLQESEPEPELTVASVSLSTPATTRRRGRSRRRSSWSA